MATIRISGQQRVRLRDALVAMFGTSAQLTPILLKVDQTYSSLQVDGWTYPETVLQSILPRAASDGWLLRFIEEALKAVADPDLAEIQKELLPLAPPAHIDPFEACRLTGSYVMVDRADLRKALRNISAAVGKRILIVNGSEKSGKTHTLQLISYLTQANGGFDLIHINLERFYRLSESKPIDPWPLALSLVKQTGYNITLPDRPTDPATRDTAVEDASSRTWARWVFDFCESFETAARLDQQSRWFVIDGFNKVVVQEATTDLIKELADRINISLTRFRLVLLGYRQAMPAHVVRHVAEENIRRIGEQEIAEFFMRAYKELKVPLDKDKIAKAVQRIIDNVNLNDPDYLQALEPIAVEEVTKIADMNKP